MSEELLNKMEEKGYLVFPNTVPADMCQKVVDDINGHIKGIPQDYLSVSGGLVEMYHYQSMWSIRQHEPIHRIFSNLFGTEKLWVSIDRTCYKQQNLLSKESLVDGFIHWDINPNESPRLVAYQGLVALTDTTEDMGGFQCCPSLYKELDEWLKSLPTEKICSGSPFALIEFNSQLYCLHNDLAWTIEKVPMKQGDLLIWDSYLLHGNGVNRGSSPRMCQYITMVPVGDERLRAERVNCFFKKKPPSGLAFPGDSRWLERKQPEVELTILGSKLIGIMQWDQ